MTLKIDIEMTNEIENTCSCWSHICIRLLPVKGTFEFGIGLPSTLNSHSEFCITQYFAINRFY